MLPTVLTGQVYVGSVEQASKNFKIKMAGTDTKIQVFWAGGGGGETLEQLGITSSAVIEVNWKNDTSNDSVDAYKALTLSLMNSHAKLHPL